MPALPLLGPHTGTGQCVLQVWCMLTYHTYFPLATPTTAATLPHHTCLPPHHTHPPLPPPAHTHHYTPPSKVALPTQPFPFLPLSLQPHSTGTAHGPHEQAHTYHPAMNTLRSWVGWTPIHHNMRTCFLHYPAGHSLSPHLPVGGPAWALPTSPRVALGHTTACWGIWIPQPGDHLPHHTNHAALPFLPAHSYRLQLTTTHTASPSCLVAGWWTTWTCGTDPLSGTFGLLAACTSPSFHATMGLHHTWDTLLLPGHGFGLTGRNTANAALHAFTRSTGSIARSVTQRKARHWVHVFWTSHRSRTTAGILYSGAAPGVARLLASCLRAAHRRKKVGLCSEKAQMNLRAGATVTHLPSTWDPSTGGLTFWVPFLHSTTSGRFHAPQASQLQATQEEGPNPTHCHLLPFTYLCLCPHRALGSPTLLTPGPPHTQTLCHPWGPHWTPPHLHMDIACPSGPRRVHPFLHLEHYTHSTSWVLDLAGLEAGLQSLLFSSVSLEDFLPYISLHGVAAGRSILFHSILPSPFTTEDSSRDHPASHGACLHRLYPRTGGMHGRDAVRARTPAPAPHLHWF